MNGCRNLISSNKKGKEKLKELRIVHYKYLLVLVFLLRLETFYPPMQKEHGAEVIYQLLDVFKIISETLQEPFENSKAFFLCKIGFSLKRHVL